MNETVEKDGPAPSFHQCESLHDCYMPGKYVLRLSGNGKAYCWHHAIQLAEYEMNAYDCVNIITYEKHRTEQAIYDSFKFQQAAEQQAKMEEKNNG